MNILWIVDVEMPDVAGYFNRKNVHAGWLEIMAKQLAEDENISIFIAGVAPETYDKILINGIMYYGFSGAGSKKYFVDLIHLIRPDIIHVWGTEYAHIKNLRYAVRYTGLFDKTIVSIQGIVSEYWKHYNDGIPIKVSKKRIRIGRIKTASLWQEAIEMKKRGRLERDFLKSAKHCIGRTEWDKKSVYSINPHVNYYYCSETLREDFYSGSWSYDTCEKHTIFFSQTHYPIKGLHQMLKALAGIKKVIPDVHLNVLGFKPLSPESIRLKSYDDYLDKLISDNDLEDNISWLGILSSKQMKEQYLKANVFVCASSIENSSNSVGEAMLLGVPVIASDRGGMRSIIEDGKDGVLYDFDSPEKMAEAVLKVFTDNNYFVSLSESAEKSAKEKYNREKNYNQLISIYENISFN